jgi:hypothetical protein
MSIFPNPVDDILHLIHQSENETAIKIAVYNLIGEEKYSFEQPHDIREINVSALESGCYLLEIISEKKNHQLLFLKK